jgi:amino acid transporter
VLAGTGVKAVAFVFVSFAFRELNSVEQDCGTNFTWAARAFGSRTGWMVGWAVTIAQLLVMTSQSAITGRYTLLLFGLDSLADNKLVTPRVLAVDQRGVGRPGAGPRQGGGAVHHAAGRQLPIDHHRGGRLRRGGETGIGLGNKDNSEDVLAGLGHAVFGSGGWGQVFVLSQNVLSDSVDAVGLRRGRRPRAKSPRRAGRSLSSREAPGTARSAAVDP